ncbi:hypothetical protein [Flavobacterium lindanitolerans]|uniref:hypothetical protein n=1 Tax=Flavobacterium lindanitolerans TaxID=428988 RepID=UPI0031D49D7C
MKKIIIISILILISCKEKTNINIKNIYYKTTSDDSKILDYRLIKYEFSGDSIFEKEVSFTINKQFYFNKKLFLKRDGDLFLLEKHKDSTSILPYLTTQTLDSCNYIKHPLANYEICNQGKEDFLNYKNCYKFDYSDTRIDGLSMTVFLDKDFTMIARVAKLATFNKITKINESEVPKEIKNKLEEEMSRKNGSASD